MGEDAFDLAHFEELEKGQVISLSQVKIGSAQLIAGADAALVLYDQQPEGQERGGQVQG